MIKNNKIHIEVLGIVAQCSPAIQDNVTQMRNIQDHNDIEFNSKVNARQVFSEHNVIF